LKRVGEVFFAIGTRKLIIIGLVLLLGVVSFYSYKSVYYAERLLPKTKVNAIDVGGLTVEQANEKITKELTEAPFAIRLDKHLWKELKRSDYGWSKDHREALKRLKQEQSPFAWGLSGFAKHQYQLPNTFDRGQVEQLVETLRMTLLEKNVTRIPTKNARIEWQNGAFKIVPEEQGTTFDIDAVQKAVKRGLEEGQSSVDAEKYYARPIMTKKDGTLKKQQEKLNQFTKMKASYRINGKAIALSNEELSSWLTTNENGEVQIDQEKVTRFVTKLNADYNTQENPTPFTSTKRGEVSVPMGIYGWSIDIPAEVQALSGEILKGKNFDRTPIVTGDAPTVQAGIGNTYVEVDLQNQYMWYYKEGKVQLETDIVSGKPSTPTPPGVNYVTSKSTDQVLRGLNEDGSKYASPVRYWMPIDRTGVGIHDSDWQYAYGGDLWLYRGSHGCINTPPAKMDELYPILETGTPVVVF